MSEKPPLDLVAYIDGGARGNPGPAAYAVVLQTVEGRPVKALTGFLGRATNNVAEYRALLAALDYAHRHSVPGLRVVSDSELLVRQIRGTYKVKSDDLKPLYASAREMIAGLESFAIEHVSREQNHEADRLVNQTLDASSGGASPQSSAKAAPFRVSAVYRSGVLKLDEPLALADGERVEVEVHRKR